MRRTNKNSELSSRSFQYSGKFAVIAGVVSLFLLLVSCGKKKEIYYCPMHPTYTSDRPGTCPICGMDLVKKEADPAHQNYSSTEPNIESSKKETIPNSSEEAIDASRREEGPSEIFLSAEKQQSIGIKTDLVLRRNLIKKLTVYSNVAYDPELYAALTEYKEALRSSEAISEAGSSISLTNLQMRLRQLGLSTDQIRVWSSQQREPSELILGGKAGRAHIYSQIYESDLSTAKVGLPFIFKTDVYPNKEFKGKIKSIDTILDKNSRTLRLRSEVSDPQHLLKPQMFGEARIEVSLPAILTLPTSAILDTGMRKMAYIQTGPDRFRPVEIQTGRTVDSWTEVISGVKEGERVVAESTFLIDSEAKIRFGNNAHSH
ncbi:HlyD family secretion protein [Leptospira fainei serovar Hurstbridge str. BUT 6]|uniref:HlyD family secretion protein n=1 Tax=Leptospira fainei serovar Hurstbridge str. BUT 6 TaxID=1193011 RepID=S3V526_9LEPT|nr:efflux RND transporter periplasmic adaptor subunit [Leptospira fainei]EPG75724.1 HlyD family secretion protein [Leptospira fainei serovar Hurstbridge str. BUT 6]